MRLHPDEILRAFQTPLTEDQRDRAMRDLNILFDAWCIEFGPEHVDTDILRSCFFAGLQEGLSIVSNIAGSAKQIAFDLADELR